MSISADAPEAKSPDTDLCTPLAANRAEKLGAGSCPCRPLIVTMSVLMDKSSSDALDRDNTMDALDLDVSDLAESEALV